MKIVPLVIALAILLMTGKTFAIEYYCEANKKFNSEHNYTEEELKKGKFAVRVEESSNGTFISRCSFSRSENQVTCDRYKVDRVEYDRNVKIKKYYVFISQFDFQIFQDLRSLENNGRGGIQYGECKVISP